MACAQYIYVMENRCFVDGAVKYGYTTNPYNRIQEANTQTPTPHRYVRIWRIDYVPDHCKEIACHDYIVTVTLGVHHGYNVQKYNGGGGTEFVVGDPDEVKIILADHGYILTRVTLEDIEKFQKDSTLTLKKTPLKDVLGIEHIEHTEFVDRQYQTQTIEYVVARLLILTRMYIELATGAGKSYVVFKIMQRLRARTVIVLSPRQIVNAQNGQAKYTNIIAEDSVMYDFSRSKQPFFAWYIENIEHPKIILACIQSHQKVWELIEKCDMTDVSIWFDEAHWGLEDWTKTMKGDPKWMLLHDDTRIAYRLFTSASPNRENVTDNNTVFGELYRPIKVCELIEEGYLCPIHPFVFSEDKENADVLYYMLKHFDKYNKKWGFSFHHNCWSAFQIAFEHYKRYKSGDTDIRPHFLVSNFNIPANTVALEDQGGFTDISAFEAQGNCIAYVVAQYSMGYDFNKIDMICFSDSKMSPKDIIQCIGRGTRPDCEGLGGRNKNKRLDVLLPVYADSKELDKYYTIAEVLAYLVGEVEIPFDRIVFTHNDKKRMMHREYVHSNYECLDEVRSKVFEATRFILNRKKKITYKYIKTLNMKLALKSRDDYLQSEDRHQCFIKDPQTIFKEDWVSWYDFIGVDTTNMIPTKEEFIAFCNRNNIASCSDYNSHYIVNKNEILPQDPFQMYSNFTNWNHELREEAELVW